MHYGRCLVLDQIVVQTLQVLDNPSLVLVLSEAPGFHSAIVFLDRAMVVGYLDCARGLETEACIHV